jgi:hypothetical protein
VSSTAPFADRVLAHFERVAREVFADDPSANRNLSVEVVGDAIAGDTPVLVVVAPWTLCGLAEPPDGRLLPTLRVGPRHYPAFDVEVDGIGAYWSVVLVPDVSDYKSQDEARAVAEPLAIRFKAAVERVRAEITGVTDPSRRSLLTATRDRPVRKRTTAFGSPETPPTLQGA